MDSFHSTDLPPLSFIYKYYNICKLKITNVINGNKILYGNANNFYKWKNSMKFCIAIWRENIV